MLSENRKIRWGIIGPGHIATSFAKDLSTVEDAELYAVASRSLHKAREFAGQFGATKAYGSYEELAADNLVDMVYIATPHVFHKEHTLLCLHAKKAVLCEKPFAMNSHEVEEMIACAKKNNVLLMEALWTAFLPHFKVVLNLLDEGIYGKIQKLEADFGFDTTNNPKERLNKKSLGGGSLLDIGIYPVFMALATMGMPETIETEATFSESGIDTSCGMVFNYRDGAKAYLKSTIVEHTPTTATFYCEKATIKIGNRFFAPASVYITANDKEEILEFPTATKGYDFEIRHFNKLLRQQKKESDVMSFGFSRDLIMLLDKIRHQIGLEY